MIINVFQDNYLVYLKSYFQNILPLNHILKLHILNYLNNYNRKNYTNVNFLLKVYYIIM
jgi:hypothetical protein